MVKGTIKESVSNDFEAAYSQLKKEDVPEGLIASYLLKDMIESELYTIETVWASQDVLKQIMETGESSADVKLFEKFDVNPSIEVFEVRDNYPQYDE